jgi:signal transduction histidine kinase
MTAMEAARKKEIHRYIPVLVLMLIMMIVSFFTFEGQYFSNQYFGQLINITGKQRMLSQRLVIEASDYLQNPSDENRERYLKYLELMENDHYVIIAMDLAPVEEAYYFKQPDLNHQVLGYIRDHRAFIEAPDRKSYEHIKSVSKSLLEDLDQAVELHQLRYEVKMKTLQIAKLVEAIVFLLVLAGSWFFVFRTSAKKIEEGYVQLEEANSSLEQNVEAAVQKNREQEELMIQQSKLAALGEMIGNIAHQWRQPISAVSAIMMNIKWTAMDQGIDPKFLEERMGEANEQLKYMSQTIDDFRNFFQPDKEKEHFDLYEVCNQAFKISKDNLEAQNIKLQVYRKRGTTTFGYPNELSQVIMNIISNAKDVMLERKVQKPRIEIHLDKDAEFVYCQIKDNGGGVSDEIIQKVFDPYFTTKFNAQGTGMGLYMSKIIVDKNMEGNLSVVNSDEGAVFTIRLKYVPDPNAEEE